MSTCLLLALDADPGGRPACLSEASGISVIERLVSQLPRIDQVQVITRTAWVSSVRERVPAVTVVGVDRARSLVDAVVAAADSRLVVLPAETVTNSLAVERLTDHAATGTTLLTAGPDQVAVDHGAPVALVRGRVVEVGSPHHVVTGATHRSLGAWSLAAGDRHKLDEAVAEVVAFVTAHPRPPDDELQQAVALLPVALVRHGCTMRQLPHPDGLVWRSVSSSTAAATAVDEVSGVDEERVRLAVAVKEQDGFFTTFFVSTYSRYLARAAARRGVTPDQVTIASMVLGLVAASGFAVGNLTGAIVGAVALQAAFTLDCVDGQLARYSRSFSTFGAWLDSIFDRGKEYVVYAGLAIGGARGGSDDGLWLLAAGLLTLQTFRHTVDLGYAEQQRRDVDEEVRRPLLDGVVDQEASFWQATPPAASASLPRRVLGWLRAAEVVPGLKWLKRIVVLPIGERFALISVLSIVSGPRLVFTVLLIWGALAAAYTVGGRAIRSFV